MIQFDFKKFGVEERFSRRSLANKVNIPYKTVCLMWNRGSLKAETLNQIEDKLGRLSQYIKKQPIIY